MRVQSIYDSHGWAAAPAVRAGMGDIPEPSKLRPGHDRQRRSGERDRRRAEPRRAAPLTLDDDRGPDPSTTLAATIASLSIGTPVEAQASCRYVAAAYADDD